MKKITQIEIIGDWRKVNFIFDWTKLSEFNKDNIFIDYKHKIGKILIKDQDLPMIYPFDTKFKSNHFNVHVDESTGKNMLYLNPNYLLIYCSSKGLKTKQKLSLFDTIFDKEDYIKVSTHSTYIGSPLTVDYLYNDTSMNCIARYSAFDTVECEIIYNKISGLVDIGFYHHYLLNGRHYSEKMDDLCKQLDDIKLLKNHLEEVGQYKGMYKTAINNLIGDTKKPSGITKHF